MVNFWPDVTLDAYINLKSRVENKMLIGNLASTGDDNLLNTKEKDLEYRKIQLQKLQEEVIDLEDLREGALPIFLTSSRRRTARAAVPTTH